MKFADGWLMTKKIAIGVVITLVPLVILSGGLWLVRHLDQPAADPPVSTTQAASHAN
jgi:hypothetical protein